MQNIQTNYTNTVSIFPPMGGNKKGVQGISEYPSTVFFSRCKTPLSAALTSPSWGEKSVYFVESHLCGEF
jgi:hypothetical protein